MLDGANNANDTIAKGEATRVDGDHTSTRINMLFHSIVIRIVSSYLQLSGMLLQFDLQLPRELPPSVCALVVVEALMSSLSESLLSIDCATSVRSDAGLFLMKQLASVWDNGGGSRCGRKNKKSKKRSNREEQVPRGAKIKNQKLKSKLYYGYFIMDIFGGEGGCGGFEARNS